MRFSRLKLNLIKNDFYGQYLNLSGHHWTKFWPKTWSRVHIWEFILHFSNFQNQPKILIITKWLHRKWFLLMNISSSKTCFDIITVVKSISRWLTHTQFLYVFKITLKVLNIHRYLVHWNKGHLAGVKSDEH